MDQYQHLWAVVQQVAPGSNLAAATLQLELDAYRGRLLHLYHNKVRAAEGAQNRLRV
jgi:hypothetical protein